MKNFIRQLLIILFIVMASGAAVLAVSDKILGGNSFESIANSVTRIFKKEDPVIQEEVDTTPLELEVTTQNMTIYESSAAITVKSNKEVYIEESNKFKLIKVSEEQSDYKYWYALEINNIGIGDADLNVQLKDKAGNTKSVALKVVRENFTLPFGMKEIEDWKDSVYTANGNNYKSQVNKEHKLIDDYVPLDLKNLNADYLLYTNTGSIMLRQEAADYLKLMLNELKKSTGKNVVIASGYRSFSEQYRLYSNWVRQLGQDEADKVSARPGFSEHQLGTVVDFIDQETGLELTNKFDQGIVGKWLKDNAQNFGFIQSYPEGKELATGYNYEAWHYRFVGIDNAKYVKESGLTLKEWLEK